jgi:hypothetical protein
MRRRRRISIHFRWPETLVAFVLLASMIAALIRWPDKVLADVAIPTAILIAFVVWRDRK